MNVCTHIQEIGIPDLKDIILQDIRILIAKYIEYLKQHDQRRNYIQRILHSSHQFAKQDPTGKKKTMEYSKQNRKNSLMI